MVRPNMQQLLHEENRRLQDLFSLESTVAFLLGDRGLECHKRHERGATGHRFLPARGHRVKPEGAPFRVNEIISRAKSS